MTLQRRLALTVLLSAVPLLAGVSWVRAELIRRTDVQLMRDLVLSRAASLGRDRCEAMTEYIFDGPPPGLRRPGAGPSPGPPPADAQDVPLGRPPMRGPGRPPGVIGPPPRPGFPFRAIQAFPYDAEFHSRSSLAPAFPQALQGALSSGQEWASRRTTSPDVRRSEAEPFETLELAVRTGWSDGPCAFILARRTGPQAGSAPRDLVAGAIPLLLGLIAAVWVASGPLVRRVRELTTAVQRSAQTHYETQVPATGRDEITDLARAFNDAGAAVRSHLATLEHRDRTLREFLANTTHDVMIPLTVLQGQLSAIETAVESGAAVDSGLLLGAVQEAQYLSSILHNLGAVAKLEAPEFFLQRHPVDLNALVERVVERHRPVARPAGVSIEYAVPESHVFVDGDVTLLEQAVSNVVHNAVRYNHAGGHVAVVLDTANDGAGFRLRVLDDGPGVNDEDLGRLTERRYRDARARQRDPNGLGLGLSIAREVADRHGIRLTFGRSEQGGLQVEFTA